MANLPQDQLADALVAGLGERPMWTDFLRLACDLLGADNAALVFGQGRNGLKEPVSFQLPMADAATPGPDAATPGLAEVLARFEDAPLDTPRLSETGESIALSIGVDADHSAWLLLWQNDASRAFSADVLPVLADLVPVFKRAARLFLVISAQERRRIVAELVIETSDIGVVLVDGDGRVMLTNSIADAILAEADGLRQVHGQVRAATPAVSASLLGHIRTKASEQQAEADWHVYAPIALPCRDKALPLTVIVRPGPAFRPLSAPMNRSAILILRDPGRRRILPPASLGRMFALSPAEALLASELASGASLDDAASQIGISRNTARSQLQAIFAKTGTNRQGELVRMLLSSAAAHSR